MDKRREKGCLEFGNARKNRRRVVVKRVAGTSATPSTSRKHQQLRLMVAGKPSSRAAVHGTRLPVPGQINKEEVEKEVSKAKEEKERKRKEVEKIVDSEMKKPEKPYSAVE